MFWLQHSVWMDQKSGPHLPIVWLQNVSKLLQRQSMSYLWRCEVKIFISSHHNLKTNLYLYVYDNLLYSIQIANLYLKIAMNFHSTYMCLNRILYILIKQGILSLIENWIKVELTSKIIYRSLKSAWFLGWTKLSLLLMIQSV